MDDESGVDGHRKRCCCERSARHATGGWISSQGCDACAACAAAHRAVVGVLVAESHGFCAAFSGSRPGMAAVL